MQKSLPEHLITRNLSVFAKQFLATADIIIMTHMITFMNDCGCPVPKTSAGNTKLAWSIKVEWKTAQSCVCMLGGGWVGGGGEREKQGVCIFCCCWGGRGVGWGGEKQEVKILRSKTDVPLLDFI